MKIILIKISFALIFEFGLLENLGLSWGELALAVAWITREIYPLITKTKKEIVEIEAGKQKIQLDSHSHQLQAASESIDLWREALQEANTFSKEVFELRTKLNDKDHESNLLRSEIKQLDNSLQASGQKLKERDATVTEQRNQIQEQKNKIYALELRIQEFEKEM